MDMNTTKDNGANMTGVPPEIDIDGIIYINEISKK